MRGLLASSAGIRGAILVSIAVMAFLGALFAGERSRRLQARASVDSVPLVPDHATLDAISLGYRNFAADVLWLKALQYHRIGSEQAHVARYADAILHLDPDFEYVYRWAATSVLYSSEGFTAEAVELSNSYLDRGATRYPDDYYYPYTKGLNWAFYYPAKTKPEKAAALRRAVEDLHVAMQKPGVPRGTPLLIAGLLNYHEDPADVLDFLEQAYLTESDPDVRRRIEFQVLTLGGNWRVFSEQKERRAKWQRENRRHLPPGLAFHVGQRLTFDVTERY